MKSILIAAFAAATLYCAPALAGTWSVQLSGFAYHYDREMTHRLHLHEVNPGAALAYEQGHRVMTFGGYQNSYGKASYYYFTGYQWHATRWLSAGVMAGLITGYERDTGYPITPAIVPFVSVGPLNFVATPWFAAMNVTVFRFD